MASAATTLPGKVSIASSLGRAVISLDLASTASRPKTNQPPLLGPGADQMQRRTSLSTVVRAAQSLPVYRDDTRIARGKLPHEPHEPSLEGVGVKQSPLAWPKSSMSAQVGPPQSMAQNALTGMSWREGGGRWLPAGPPDRQIRRLTRSWCVFPSLPTGLANTIPNTAMLSYAIALACAYPLC